jgi:kynurenine formamidase
MSFKGLLFILALTSSAAWAGTPQYIDLSHDYSAETPHWPGSPAFKITHVFTASKPGEGSVRDYASNEHVGTHMDAPNHFSKGHPGIDAIPLSELIGPAIKIDVSQEANKNRDYLIGIKDFEQWEASNGKIPAGSIVLLSTGFGRYWPQMEKYSGVKSAAAENSTHLHFPGLDPLAAAWLVNERHIKAIGIDTLSIDFGQSKTFEAHQFLTQRNIPIFENVARMEALPAKQFRIYALPMKIKDGTGAPLRIVAQLSE